MDNKLYIPYGIKMEWEFFAGFGKKELRQSIIGMVLSLIISFFFGALMSNIPTVIIVFIAGAFTSIAFTTKDQNNISIVTHIKHMVKFRTSVQKYKYKYKDEYRR